MKLTVPERNVTSNGVISESSFTITASAKAFKILSSSLYKDKILAIVRELSCNAYDSHVDNGNKGKPFDVHIPTILNPYFKVRDYGTGISHDDMMSLYVTYFNSTKTDSNDFIGALGLGSKSPFSYADTFNVNSFKDGRVKSYTAYIDDAGTPNISLMTDLETDQPNGIEVSVYVNESDFHTFRTKIGSVYQYFAVKPKVNGYEFQKSSEKTVLYSGDKWALYSRGYNDVATKAIQGNIGYEIAASAIINLPEHLRSVIQYNNIELFFNIGDLEVAASREELSYDERTSDNIKEVLSEIYATVRRGMIDQLDVCETRWKAQMMLIDIKNEYPTTITNHLKTFNLKYDGEPLRYESSVDINKISDDAQFSLKRFTKQYDKVKGTSVKFSNIPYSDSTIIIFNDVNRLHVKRLKLHILNNVDSGQTVYFFNIPNWVMDRDKTMKTIVDYMGNPEYMMLSETDEPPKVARVKRDKAKGEVLTFIRKGNHNTNYSWNKCSWDYDELENPTNIVYLPMFRFEMLGGGRYYNPGDIRKGIELLVKLDVLPEDVVIYGLRASHLKRFPKENIATFRNLIDVIDDYVKKIDLRRIRRYNALDISEYSYSWNYLERISKRLKVVPEPMAQYLADKKFHKSEKNSEKSALHRTMLHMFGSHIVLSDDENKEPSSHDKVLELFPLFKTFNELALTHQERIPDDEVMLYVESKLGVKT